MSSEISSYQTPSRENGTARMVVGETPTTLADISVALPLGRSTPKGFPASCLLSRFVVHRVPSSACIFLLVIAVCFPMSYWVSLGPLVVLLLLSWESFL